MTSFRSACSILTHWFFGALVLLSLAGCQSFASLQKPEVSLIGLQVAEIGLMEQQWQVALRVTNPNERELTLKTLDYVLYVDNKKFASGMNQSAVTLPARGSTQVTTTVTTSLLSILNQLSGLTNTKDEVPYRVTGTARITGWALPISFDHASKVKLPALQ